MTENDQFHTSPPGVNDGAELRCLWCTAPPATGGRYCSRKCRQAAWRARRLLRIEGNGGAARRLAYADPPYPGTAAKYYRNEPNFAGEVDHAELLERLSGYDGWALSTSAKALRDVLPLCPPGVRIASWTKPHSACPLTRGPHNCWEPVIYSPARLRRPGVRDWLSAQPARFGGTLPGRKPIAFCAWMFALLGADPGDSLDDLFPGTGVVQSSWRQLGLMSSGDDDGRRQSTHEASSAPGRYAGRSAPPASFGAAHDARRPGTGESFGAVEVSEVSR